MNKTVDDFHAHGLHVWGRRFDDNRRDQTAKKAKDADGRKLLERECRKADRAEEDGNAVV